MSINENPYRVFNQVKEELQHVSDAISPNSVRTRQDRITVLTDWHDTRWNILYHDKSDLQYDNSISVLEKELRENQQHLRHNGFDLLSYKQELLEFISSSLIPLQTRAEQLIMALEGEIKISCDRMPTKPVGFSTIVEGARCIGFRPGEYERYQQRNEAWQKENLEMADYHSKLESMDRDLDVIKQTVEKYAPLQISEKASCQSLPVSLHIDSLKLTIKKPIQAVLALFYFYCHEKQCLPVFPAGKMEEAYRAVTTPYGMSSKSFQQTYNRFKKRSERLAESNRNALVAAIQMLQPYPEALQLAKDELKTSETRNPLT